MKTRKGFISNSSTTSFCIYGISIDPNEIKTILNLPDTEGIYEAIEEESKNKDISLYFIDGSEYSDCFYIGQAYSSIEDNETGAQFKQRVKEEVNKLFDNQIEENRFGTIEEAWRDG